MESLGVKAFGIPRTTWSTAHDFTTCANPHQIRYMAASVNKWHTGMQGTVNCQAVVGKIRSLQRKFGAGEDDFQRWREALNVSDIRQQHGLSRVVHKTDTTEDKLKKIFSSRDVKVMTENNELILEFIQSLNTNKALALELMQILKTSSETSSPESASTLIHDVIKANLRLKTAGQGGLLPRLLSVLALHGHLVDNFPVVIQDMYDFATILSGQHPSGMRWTTAKKDEWAWLLRTGGKQVVINARGFGWSKANPDDDAGMASRKRKREGQLTDEENDGDGGSDTTYESDNKMPRFNRPIPSRRTLQRHVSNAKDTMKSPGIYHKELESFTKEVVAAGQDAGLIALAFDKVQLAQAHPGDGCTGAGETDCAGLMPGAGEDLAARQAWKMDVREKLTLSVSDMKSMPKVLAWHDRVSGVWNTNKPMLKESKAKHQDSLKKKQQSAKDKCNEACGSKFGSFEDAMASVENGVRAKLHKGKAARDILQESIQMCDSATDIFESVLSELERDLGIPSAEAAVEDVPGPSAPRDVRTLPTKNALKKYVAELRAAGTALYIGCKRTTATHMLAVIASETNRNPKIPSRAVVVVAVNNQHTPERTAPLMTSISVEAQEYGYVHAICLCSDGEYLTMACKDSEGGVYTRYALWSACAAVPAGGRGPALHFLQTEIETR